MHRPKWNLKIVTEPTAEPITTAEAKAHLRVDIADDDTLIAALVKAARRWCEEATNRAFVTQTWDLRLDHFPGWGSWRGPYADLASVEILVPISPLASVTSITYVDTDGTSQTLATAKYTVDSASEPARIVPAYGESWPDTRDVPNAVTVRFVAGYGAATAVPERIKAAIKLMVASLYENREPVNIGNIVTPIEFTLSALLAQDTVRSPYSF